MWAAEWNEVVFTEESRICLQHHDGRIQVWRHREKRIVNSCVMHRHTGPAPSIMVQNSLRHHLERWRTQKTVGKTPRHSVGHLSPHHGESIALYRDRGARESCTSFTTTTSVVNLPKRSGSANHLMVQDDML
ncbi:diuretic hormone receptor [Trichonephila clavipes]|nr:diuretic hormone receptor [Trichonephila clavipes]